MNYDQLYARLATTLDDPLPTVTTPQIRNLALVTLALVYSPDCHLASLATRFPVPGQRENLIQRTRRWLDNPAVTQQRCYMPLVRQLFTAWSGTEVSLVMDRTDLNDRLSILMLAAAYRHRALPLAWRVLPFGGTDATTQLALLKQVQPVLPPLDQVRITFYGDSEFRAVKVQQYCQQQGWQWQVGLKSDLLFRQGTDAWHPLRTIPVSRGERCYLHGITLTQQHAFGPLNLIADWTHADETPRHVATDQPAHRDTWRRGRKRFWIEPFFRDWKSYGFDLERCHLMHPPRLDTLLLALATASLWMMHVGHWLDVTGRRVLLEARHKRDYSLFRLGRDYACRCQVRDWPLPIGFTVGF